MHYRRGLVVMTVLSTACLPARGTAGEINPADVPVRVEVTNHHPLAIELYAVGAGIRHRLGTVHPGMKAVFKVPPALVGGGQVEFHATPTAGGETYRSGGLLLSPAAIVDIVIAAQLFASTAVLRP
jgi:hypothetical protein